VFHPCFIRGSLWLSCPSCVSWFLPLHEAFLKPFRTSFKPISDMIAVKHTPIFSGKECFHIFFRDAPFCVSSRGGSRRTFSRVSRRQLVRAEAQLHRACPACHGSVRLPAALNMLSDNILRKHKPFRTTQCKTARRCICAKSTHHNQAVAGWPWAVARPGLPQIRTCPH